MRNGQSRLTLVLFLIIVLALSFEQVLASGVGESFLLIRKGEARMPIVISEKASPVTQTAANELAQYLGRMSGAALEVMTGGGPSGIVVGTIDEFPAAEVADALKIYNGIDGREAFAIIVSVEPERVILLGATDRAVSHAVYRFLHKLGCRRFFSAPEWEVIPSLPDVMVNTGMSETSRPALLSRGIWFNWGMFDAQASRDYEAWLRHNGMGASFNIRTGHSDEEMFGWYRAQFAAHPEFLALVDGKRRGNKLCYSNPGLQKLVVAYCLGYFARNPDETMVSIEPGDGGGHCQCDACRAMGSVSDRVFNAANIAARAVAEKYPGRMVGLLAYHKHAAAPDFELEPNVYVQLATRFIQAPLTFDGLMEQWTKKCSQLGYYDYYSVWQWSHDAPGSSASSIGYIKTMIPRMLAANATSINAESANSWGPNGLGYYLASKLMWNPEADVDAILTDFYEKAFGPAAAPMRHYYENFWWFNQPSRLAQGYADIAEACKLASDRPDVLARLTHLKHYLRYLYLWRRFNHPKDQDEKKAMVLAIMEHNYRTRRAYMTHWQVYKEFWSHRIAQQYKEPTWSSHIGRPEPHRIAAWENDAPYTQAEIERHFQEGLAFFTQIKPVP